MAGSIIENMSSRKLGYVLAGASVILLLCFLLGALVSPTQTASMQYLATKVQLLTLRLRSSLSQYRV